MSGLQTAICSWLQTCSCHLAHTLTFTPYLSITLLEMVYQPLLYLAISLLVVLPHTRCQTSHQPPATSHLTSHINTTGNHSQIAFLNRLYRDETGRDYPDYPEYSHQQYEDHRSLPIWGGGGGEIGELQRNTWHGEIHVLCNLTSCLRVAFGVPPEDGDKIRV